MSGLIECRAVPHSLFQFFRAMCGQLAGQIGTASKFKEYASVPSR